MTVPVSSNRGVRLATALIAASLWVGCESPPDVPAPTDREESAVTPPLRVTVEETPSAAEVGTCAALLAAGARPDLAPPVQPVAPADTVGRALRPFRQYLPDLGVILYSYRYERAGTPPGPVFIEPFFRFAMPYREGRALVMDAATHCFGYLGPDGMYAVEPRFEEAGDFSEGLAPAAETDGLWGYIDRQGRWAIPPRFDSFIRGFDGGRTWASFGGRYGRIDREGQFIVAPRFDIVMVTADPDAAVMTVGEDGRVGLYDTAKERVIIEPQFAWVMPDEGGLMRAATGTVMDMGMWGYLDAAGQWAISPQFRGVGALVGDTAFVLLPDSADTADVGGLGPAFGDHLAQIDRAGRVLDHPIRDARNAVPSHPVELVFPDSLFTDSAVLHLPLDRVAHALSGPVYTESSLAVGNPMINPNEGGAYVAFYRHGVVLFSRYGYETMVASLYVPGAEFGQAARALRAAVEQVFAEAVEEQVGDGVRFSDPAAVYAALGVWPTATGVVVRTEFGL